MNRPRKDYGCPLRIYSRKNSSHRYTIIPPRSDRAWARYRRADGSWEALFMPALSDHLHVAQLGLCDAMPGPHLGKRIAWAELPEPVQRALRASFLGEYCPKGEA